MAKKKKESKNFFLSEIGKKIGWPFFSLTPPIADTYFVMGRKVKFSINSKELSTLPLDQFYSQLRKRIPRKVNLYLSQPFVNVYLHEAISLRSKELGELDKRTLPFSTTPAQFRKVYSIQLGSGKSVIVHAHLTDKGINFITKLKKARTLFFWNSIIPFALRAILQNPPTSKNSKRLLRLYLEEEIMQINFNPDGELVSYLPLSSIPQISSNYKQEQIADLLLGKSEESEPDIADLDKLLLNHFTESRWIRISKPFFWWKKVDGMVLDIWRGKKEKRRIQIRIKPLYLLSLSFLILLVWSIGLEIQNSQTRVEKNEVTLKLKELSGKATILNQLREVERKFYRWEALKETLSEIHLQPIVILSALDKMLTDKVWLEEISMEKGTVNITFLAADIRKLTEFRDSLRKQVESQKITSEESRVVFLQGKELQQYIIQLEDINALGKTRELEKQ